MHWKKWATCLLIACCASWTAEAQGLLPDSTVQGITHQRLERWAARRVADSLQVLQLRFEADQERKAAHWASVRANALEGAVQTQRQATELCRQANVQLRTELAAEQQANASLKPWATAGKVAAGSAAVVVVLAILNALTP